MPTSCPPSVVPGSGRRITAFSALKMVATPPTPIAIVVTTTALNIGARTSSLPASRTSAASVSSNGRPCARRWRAERRSRHADAGMPVSVLSQTPAAAERPRECASRSWASNTSRISGPKASRKVRGKIASKTENSRLASHLGCGSVTTSTAVPARVRPAR